MENPLILVADADPKNLQILRDSLESTGFSVIVAQDGLEAWEKIQSEHPDLILSELNLPNFDGFQLLEKLKETPSTSSVPVMFLTSRRDIQDRVRSLRGGVKDYMIKPLHVKEVIARIRMILRRIGRVKSDSDDADKKMAGRIEEYGVIELIDNFGANRKTGVLQLYNEQNRNGEIWFKSGAVVHASFGTLKAEKAVYQMLPWQQGHFIMTFKEVNVPETINVSNLGLLLHGYKRMEQREQLFKQLPSPETTFVLTDEFRRIVSNKELSQEASKFLALIDGRRDIMQIIDESVYDDIQSLERLAKLYKQKFIKPGKPADQTSTEINISAIKNEILTDDITDVSEESEQMPGAEETSSAQQAENDAENQDDLSPQSQEKIDASDFPPPDLDVLDAEDEEELPQDGMRVNGVRDKLFTPMNKPENTQENDEPQTEELRDTPDKSFLDHFDFKSTLPKSKHPSESLPAEEPEETPRPQPRREHTLMKPRSDRPQKQPEIPENDEFAPDLPDESAPDLSAEPQESSFPEPLHYNEFAPGLDISKPFAKYEYDDKPSDLDVETEEAASAPDSFIDSPDQIQEYAADSTDQPQAEPQEIEQDEDAEEPAKISQTEAKTDSKKQTYSFPLRSYGKPRIEKKHDQPDEQPQKEKKTPVTQLRTDPQHEEESGDRTQLEPPKKLAERVDLPRQSPPPKPPQIQKVKPKSEPSKPVSPQRPASKTFADIEHIIARQRTRQADPQEPQVSPAPQPEATHAVFDEIDHMLHAYLSETGTPGQKLVLIGSEKKLIEAFADYVMHGQPLRESQSNIFQYFAAGERTLEDGVDFATIGVTMEKQFTHLLDKIAANLAGYILLIDASEIRKLNYISYLHTVLKKKFDCPHGIAIFDNGEKKNFALDTIKDLIGAASNDLVMKLELSNDDDHVQFLREFLNESKENSDHR